MDDRRAAALFRGVFEGAHDAVLIVGPDGRILLTNARCAEVLGHDASTLIGAPIEVLVPDGVGPEPGRRRAQAVRADGTEYTAEVAIAPIDVDGATYVAVTVRDITGRVRAEERYDGVIEAAPDPTLVVGPDGRVVMMNSRVSDVLGFAGEDLIGMPLHAIVAYPPADEIDARLAAYLLDPRPMPMGYTQEFRARHRNGHELPIEISLGPVRADEETYVVVAVRDVSERIRIQAEAQRLRDELIATVSHELRTPLTSIIGYAEMLVELDETDISQRARSLLAVIERNAARELRLVDDLLTMAFLDDNRLRVVRARIDLAEVCRRVVEDQGLGAAERDRQLVLVDAALPPVLGDFFRLVQVVENLVTNAVKFTPAGGRIEVRVLDRGSKGVVEVSDNGVGVSPEERDRLFDRLYRAPSAIEAHVQGAGLGLAIVRAIVDAHDGTIEVESEVGVGTTVRVAIPYAVD